MDEVIKFLKEHKEVYSEYFIKNRLEKCKYGYTCDIDQIYCYLNLLDIKSSEYYPFYNIANKYFNLYNKKILEVGCGYIPILASIFKMNDIDIDAMDKQIVISNYKNVKTIEFDLTNDYDIKKYDLIIGFRLCDITEKVIELCYRQGKNFMIYMCPCIHKPLNNKNIKFSTYEEWIEYLTNKIQQYDCYNLTIMTNDELPDNCPILIGSYQKKL